MTKTLNVLIACEESQAICREFRLLGHNAFSADLQQCSGGHPEWHILGDCLPIIDGNCTFKTMDGKSHTISGQWDILIAHPPCTYLTVSGNRWFNVEKYGEKALKRIEDRAEGVAFFMKFVSAKCDHIAIENPIGVMSRLFCKPTQIIQPYWFGDAATKATCLWLKNLPSLTPTNWVKDKIQYKEWTDKNGKKKRQDLGFFKCLSLSKEDRQRERSKTFQGIAQAIAVQWSRALGGL